MDAHENSLNMVLREAGYAPPNAHINAEVAKHPGSIDFPDFSLSKGFLAIIEQLN